MTEKFSSHGFLKLEKEKLEKARELTVPSEGMQGYGIISSPLEEYEKILLSGRLLSELVKEVHELRPVEPVKILDFGCGKNAALRDLIKQNVSGIEIEATGNSVGDPRSEEQKEFDRENNIKFIDQKEVTVTFPINEYDIILSKMTFGHLPNPLQTLKKLYNSLKIGGIMYVEFPTRGWLSLANKFYDMTSYDKAIKQANDFIKELKESGIDIDSNGKRIVIKKNDVEMKFRSIKFSPGAHSSEDAKFNIYTKKAA
jgi:SAM-dependent methyltransferase